MAIITPEQLLESREADEAGVSAASPNEVKKAIRIAEAVLNKSLGYRVANDEESITVTSRGGTTLHLPERVRSVSEITQSFRGGTATDVLDPYEIQGKGFSVFRASGWRDGYTIEIAGEFGFEPYEDIDSVVVGDDEYILAQQFVTLLAVRILQKSGGGNMPSPGGAYLTGYQSENASFTFFTPTGDSTGYQDLDVLLDQIGRHPNKTHGLYTVSIEREPLAPESLLDFEFDRGRLT